MRWIALVLVGALVACGGKEDAGKGSGDTQEAVPYPEAQYVVDAVAEQHPALVRLTLHTVPTDKTALTQVASTMAERRGKPSDPEDMRAMESGEEVVLEEPGAIDVTVPILMKDGKPTAIAGVTVTMEEGADRDALLDEARAIAKELEAEVKKADKALW